jgi:hypothetical protein
MGTLLLSAAGAAAAPLTESVERPALPGAPRAQVRESVVDLGRVDRGKRVEARFALGNTGDAPLRILHAEVGCRCALVSVDATIAPRQVGYVTASLDTSEMKGPVSKPVTVVTNDPLRPRIDLELRADVLASVSILPGDIVYMRLRDGTWDGRALIRKDPTEAGALEVSDIRTSADWLDVSVARLDQPAPRRAGIPAGVPGDWVVDLRFSGGAPVFGEQSETVTFATGLPREPRARLVVIASIASPVHLSTESLTLRPQSDGRAAGTVAVSVRRGLDPALLAAEAQPSTLDVQLTSTGERMFDVRVVAPPGGRGSGHVDFRVGDEFARLPVSWSDVTRP